MPQDLRYLMLHEGEVTRRDDPETLGRVKAIIPGFIEPETPNWCWPMGFSGAGSAQHGTYDPPAVGSTVMIMFKMGDPDRPYYLCGPYGKPNGVSDVPTNAAIDSDSSGKANKQNVVTEDEIWRIERDSRVDHPFYKIINKSSDTSFFIDGERDEIKLIRTTASQAGVKGTEYRSAEKTFLNSFLTAIKTFSSAVKIATTVAEIATAAGTLETALNSLSTHNMVSDESAYLSERLFLE